MGGLESLRSRRNVLLLLGALGALAFFRSRRSRNRSSKSKEDAAARDKRKKNAIGINKQFFAQLKKLIAICVPGVHSVEFRLLITLAAVLLGRTWLDEWFATFNSQVVSAIVTRNEKQFISKAIIEFLFMMWPLSIVNNSLKICISALSSRFRARLTRRAHDLYLSNLNFYKVSNLDSRLQNPDQLMTQDIERFSDNLSHLYSDISKPIVDIFLFASKIGQALGGTAPFELISYFLLSGTFLRAISPPFGKLIAEEQRLEGDYRFIHSRIITHAEEIAFYRGAEKEKLIAQGSFAKIRRHLYRLFSLRFANGVIDNILVKYMATMTAYWILARPVFDSRYATKYMGREGASATEIMEDYSRNSTYLVKLSQAVGSLMMEMKHVAQFAGYTARVHELFKVLEDVNKGHYERTTITEQESKPGANENVAVNVVDKKDIKGQYVHQDRIIEFERVPIVTPNGDVLVKAMSFQVKPGMNTLITGPNGCGKSSLFRILGRLWPLLEGTVRSPAQESLFYVPQKPYLSLGTLRDQIIYPHTRQEALARGFDDAALSELLESVRLAYFVERENGWDAVADWSEVMSGGEKQKLAMGRLFYHCPQFAILDECTSAMSVDVEAEVYTRAQEKGITLFTVAHRPSLWKFHEFLLRFDGEGHYEFTRLLPGMNPFKFGHGKTGAAAAVAAAAASGASRSDGVASEAAPSTADASLVLDMDSSSTPPSMSASMSMVALEEDPQPAKVTEDDLRATEERIRNLEEKKNQIESELQAVAERMKQEEEKTKSQQRATASASGINDVEAAGVGPDI